MIFIISSIQKDNRGLGFENDLLFKIPADLKRFRDLTTGHPVIMGRRTWESLPLKFRPLPGRTNIVVSSQTEGFEGAIVCKSVPEAIAEAKKIDSEIGIIGGAGIFTEALPYTDTLYLTEIDAEKEADVFFPEFKNDFIESKREGPFETTEGINYWFVEYKRK
jgi:dihydrofolate reductase